MERYHEAQYFLKKQIFFVLLGLTAMVFLTKVPYQKLRYAAYPGLAAAAVLLGLILIPHVGVRAGGATRWLNLGIITFQVTELVKVALVLFLAHFLTRKIAQIKQFSRGIAIPLGVTLFVVGLVMLQPDFGSAAILMAILLLMLYLAGTRLAYLGGLAAAFLPVALYLVIHKSYRMVGSWPFSIPGRTRATQASRSSSRSVLRIGRTFGVGLGDGCRSSSIARAAHGLHPVRDRRERLHRRGHRDPAVRRPDHPGFFIAFKAPDLFGTLLAAGLTMTLALEAFINIAGVMGLIPLKGLALPFLSYGGSALLMSLAAVGILLNISAQES